jgi:hypothetical protein
VKINERIPADYSLTFEELLLKVAKTSGPTTISLVALLDWITPVMISHRVLGLNMWPSSYEYAVSGSNMGLIEQWDQLEPLLADPAYVAACKNASGSESHGSLFHGMDTSRQSLAADKEEAAIETNFGRFVILYDSSCCFENVLLCRDSAASVTETHLRPA